MKIVLSNVSAERADALARTLVEERLAACVNCVPVRSVYRWKGDIQTDEEVTLHCKVSASGVAALVDRIKVLHPYELPEIIVLDVDVAQSLGAYVAWVRENS